MPAVSNIVRRNLWHMRLRGWERHPEYRSADEINDLRSEVRQRLGDVASGAEFHLLENFIDRADHLLFTLEEKPLGV